MQLTWRSSLLLQLRQQDARLQAQDWAALPDGPATYLGNPVPCCTLPTILAIEFMDCFVLIPISLYSSLPPSQAEGSFFVRTVSLGAKQQRKKITTIPIWTNQAQRCSPLWVEELMEEENTNFAKILYFMHQVFHFIPK